MRFPGAAALAALAACSCYSASAFAPPVVVPPPPAFRGAAESTRLGAATDRDQLKKDIARFEAAAAVASSRPEKISADIDAGGIVGAIGFLGAAVAILGIAVLGGVGGESPGAMPSPLAGLGGGGGGGGGASKPAAAEKVKVVKAAASTKKAAAETSPPSAAKPKAPKPKPVKKAAPKGPYDLDVDL